MQASKIRFIPDALLQLRADNSVPCTSNTFGSPVVVDQTAGYWGVKGAEASSFAVDFIASSVTGSVVFGIAISTDPSFTTNTIALAKTGPVTAPGHTVLGLSRDAIDAALAALGAAVDVPSGSVSIPTAIYLTGVALVPNGSAVSWSCYEAQFVG